MSPTRFGDDAVRLGRRGVRRRARDVDAVMLNRVIGLGVARPATDADARPIAERVRRRCGTRSRSRRGAARPTLADVLRARGYDAGLRVGQVRRGRPIRRPVRPTDLRRRADRRRSERRSSRAWSRRASGSRRAVDGVLAAICRAGRAGAATSPTTATAAAAGALYVRGRQRLARAGRRRCRSFAAGAARARSWPRASARRVPPGAAVVVTETGETVDDRPRTRTATSCGPASHPRTCARTTSRRRTTRSPEPAATGCAGAAWSRRGPARAASRRRRRRRSREGGGIEVRRSSRGASAS